MPARDVPVAQLPRWVAVFVALVCAAMIVTELWHEQNERLLEVAGIETSTTNLAGSLVQQAEDTVELANTALVALVERIESDPDALQARERRRDDRKPLRTSAEIILPTTRTHRCVTVNVSPGGAQLEIPRSTLLPGEFLISIPARRIRQRARLVWRGEDAVGIQFV